MALSGLPDPIPQAQRPPHSEDKNVVSQIRRYNRWLAESGRLLHQPDLTSYRDLLLETLAPASARVHLSSIRRSYKILIENPQHRATLVDHLQQEYPTADFATIKAMADELELRLMRAIDPQQRLRVSDGERPRRGGQQTYPLDAGARGGPDVAARMCRGCAGGAMWR